MWGGLSAPVCLLPASSWQQMVVWQERGGGGLCVRRLGIWRPAGILQGGAGDSGPQRSPVPRKVVDTSAPADVPPAPPLPSFQGQCPPGHPRRLGEQAQWCGGLRLGSEPGCDPVPGVGDGLAERSRVTPCHHQRQGCPAQVPAQVPAQRDRAPVGLGATAPLVHRVLLCLGSGPTLRGDQAPQPTLCPLPLPHTPQGQAGGSCRQRPSFRPRLVA